jgi:hypothetical protein
MIDREANEFDAAATSGLGPDPIEVRMHSLDADEQTGGDLLITTARADQPEHLDLPDRQARFRPRPTQIGGLNVDSFQGVFVITLEDHDIAADQQPI